MNRAAMLLTERERLEGSLDLCRKMIEDQVSDDFDMNYYLNYVKTEEEQELSCRLCVTKYLLTEKG